MRGGSSGDILMFAKFSSGRREVSSLTELADVVVVVARTVPWSPSHLSLSILSLFTWGARIGSKEGIDPSEVVIAKKLVASGGEALLEPNAEEVVEAPQQPTRPAAPGCWSGPRPPHSDH